MDVYDFEQIQQLVAMAVTQAIEQVKLKTPPMTRRQEYKARVMEGYLAGRLNVHQSTDGPFKTRDSIVETVKRVSEYADAMLAEDAEHGRGEGGNAQSNA